MPKQIPRNEFDAILAIISGFPNGASIHDILKKFERPLPRRSLQRRLMQLVKTQRLEAHGHARATRYKLPVAHYRFHQPDTSFLQIRETAPPARQEIEIYVPLSPLGQQIKQSIRKPLHERQPVGYQRQLLDSYLPNVTQYLPEDLRQHLQKIGHAPDGDHPAGTYARQIFRRLLIDLSWNSSRLEGNTYSLLETERLLELGEAAEGKNLVETQMILNHKAAIEFLIETAGENGFNHYTLLNLHALLANNLLASTACGSLRNIPVGIHKTVYHPTAIPQVISECFQQILNTATAISNPFEQAFFIMVHLPYLQPFEDINKRVSRLAANIPFINQNFCPLAFVDVPEQAYIDGLLGVYELNRMELLRDVFTWAYKKSADRYSAISRSISEPDPLRLRYHKLIAATAAMVIKQRLNKKDADLFIKQQAAHAIPKPEQTRFVEIVETELLELHEGNIARYHIPLTEFRAWHTIWQKH